MLLFNKSFVYSLFFLTIPVFSFSQNCNLTINGYILDESTGIALPYANVFINETKTGIVADNKGRFELKQICPGSYHLYFSHVGCETKSRFISVTKDTTLTVLLNHHSELLDEVVIHAEKKNKSTQLSATISKEDIAEEGNKNLADILESIQGVSVIRNGSGISKPVVHGLSGNRVSILNNDIAQSGQQWGNDHSPEIDPLIADHISVIKGASALQYTGNSLGGVVLVETSKISDDPHLHGDANYIFQSNGLGHTLNTHVARYDKWVAWKITATLKALGDMKSPDYYLTNSGKREGNFAVQLEKKISDKWNTSLYYSFYNADIGILRGSHIGNLTDLEQSIGRDEPFFTKEHFSYDIEAPKQQVQHHLLKIEAKYSISGSQSVNFKYGGQLNNRKEFDVRRSGRSDIPALSLLQNSQFAEGTYNNFFSNGLRLKSGLQFNYVDNTNNPETEILPLIPDYRSYHGSAFFIFKKEQNRLFYELGARYDMKQLNVLAISKTLPRQIERFDHLFHNYSLSSGTKYQVTKSFKTNLDIGYVLRAPEINELYSFGLHQGVSGIEEGDRGLDSEKSLKFVLSADWNIMETLFFQATGYYQNIEDFIYLQPQHEFRLTIRGAFPVFLYQQTNAVISGTDLLLSFEPTKDLKVVAKFAAVKGTDKKQKVPLINMPATNLTGSVAYSLKDFIKLKDNSVSLTGKYVFKQTDLLEEQDFLEPPDAYFLLGLNAATKIVLENMSTIKLSVNIENMLNRSYRDYLNRQRYFADDTGINVSLRVNYSF